MEEKKTFWKSSSARWVITAILYIVVFGGALFCDAFLSTYLPDGFELLVIIPGAVFAYFGWKALNRIQPSMFLWMSWTGWFIYVFVKFFLSLLIGMFVTPWVLGRNIANYIQQE